jgi:hypothetical protein
MSNEGKGIRSAKKVAGVIKSNIQHTNDLEGPQERSATASLGHLVGPTDILPVPNDREEVVLSQADLDEKYKQELKFNEEMVELTIDEDTNTDFPIDPVPMSVNGQQIFVSRGIPTMVKRKYVECLCQPKVGVTTRQKKNNLGEDVTDLHPNRSLQFPFSVADSNPRGRKWLADLKRRA